MTAIVGVLNRQGAAFAADSAATRKFGDEYRVNYHANKIFALSKYHPVGICVYNTLSFLGVPWETIFKMYRSNLGDKKYNSLAEYVDSFWTFIKKEILASFDSEQYAYFSSMAVNYWKEIKDLALKDIGGTINEDNKLDYYTKIKDHMNKLQMDFEKNQCNDFKDYNIKKFEKYGGEDIEKLIKTDVDDINEQKLIKQTYISSLLAIMENPSFVYCDKSNYTGLVFWGYGEKDVFPSYIEYKVTNAFDKHVKYWQIDLYQASNNNNACIAPFAQTEVTNTYIRSVESKLRSEFCEASISLLSDFRNEIVDLMNKSAAPKEFVEILEKIDTEKYKSKYSDHMDTFIRKNYTKNLIETVSYLSKEDLADMAENLVRMTCLKKHITSELESVGGPVDVAVITKGDGFVWIKRKHYFDAELNQQFFERYNR